MSTIYQDYRPNSFSEILGQNHIKITLQNEIITNNLGHAYLFCGPRAVGKTTTARILAKAVNCSKRKEGEFEPCNTCSNCLSIKKGNNFDVLEIDAASNTGVDNVRDNIISFSRIVPSNGKYKVFIIDEVHMLSNQAFNALLKIMEEPPTYVIFILCTTEIQKVPGTIISRCERFDFKKISSAEIVDKLTAIVSQEKISVDKDVLEAIAKNSGGYMRDAESLLGQVMAVGGKVIKKEQAELILPANNDREAILLLNYINLKDTIKAFTLINDLADKGVNLKNFNNDLIGILRHLMIEKFSPGLGDTLGLDLGEDLEKEISSLAKEIENNEVLIFLRKFMEISNSFSNQNIVQLPLEIAVAELCLGCNNSSVNTSHNIRAVNYKNETAEKVLTKKELDTINAHKDTIKSIDTTTNSEEGEKVIKNNVTNEERNCLEIKNMSAEEVYAKWPEFLVKIKNQNHSLSFVLQSCRPKSIENNILCLSFKYKFHQNRINETDIRLVVRNVLQEVYGKNLDFNTIIDEDLSIVESTVESSTDTSLVSDNKTVHEAPASEDSQSEKSTSLGSLLNVFGGEVIN